MLRKVVWMAAFSCLAGSASAAICLTPSAPDEKLPPRKPSLPFCAYSKTCAQWQDDAYKRELDRYGFALKRYVSEVQEEAKRYQEEAAAYAKCEMRDKYFD